MATTLAAICPGCFRHKGSEVAICPHCGYDAAAPRSPLLLPALTRLNQRYLIGRTLGKPGGFGVTYLGFDLTLQVQVAVKEYCPRDLVGRDTSRRTLAPHSQEDGELFQVGLQAFLDEARTLAKFDHANVVRVRDFFETNGTAYLVMDYYEGESLLEYLERHGGKLPWRAALELMLPVLDGLREVHRRGFLHRDVKPHNIYLTTQGRPILLDFGSARQAMGERSRSLSVMITEGYAPFEQYHRRGQGPWTDIYGLAATLYLLITGLTPPPAPERKAADTLIPPQTLAPDIPPILNNFILTALSVDPQKRTQDLETFQKRLLAVTEGFSASGNLDSLTAVASTPITTTKFDKVDQIKSTKSISRQKSNNSFIEWCLSHQLIAIVGGVFILFIGYKAIGLFKSDNTEPNKETVTVQTEIANIIERIKLDKPQQSSIPLEDIKKKSPSIQNETESKSALGSQRADYLEAERKRRIEEQQRRLDLQRIEQEHQMELLRAKQERFMELQREEQQRRKKLERDQQADDQLRYWSCVNAMLKRGSSGADAQFQCRR